jgi:hypothetical protein
VRNYRSLALLTKLGFEPAGSHGGGEIVMRKSAAV